MGWRTVVLAGLVVMAAALACESSSSKSSSSSSNTDTQTCGRNPPWGSCTYFVNDTSSTPAVVRHWCQEQTMVDAGGEQLAKGLLGTCKSGSSPTPGEVYTPVTGAGCSHANVIGGCQMADCSVRWVYTDDNDATDKAFVTKCAEVGGKPLTAP